MYAVVVKPISSIGIALHHPDENPNPKSPIPRKIRAMNMTVRRPYRSARTPITGLANPGSACKANSQLKAAIVNPNPNDSWGIKGENIRLPISTTSRMRNITLSSSSPTPKKPIAWPLSDDFDEILCKLKSLDDS